MGRKFFIVLFLVLILLGGGVFSLWLIGKKSLAEKLAAEAKTPFYLRDQGDTDNDGLKDWEELLWRTDLSKPDSDGDGTADGEEVAANRNPLKPGPDDQLVEPEERLVKTLGEALRDRTEPLITDPSIAPENASVQVQAKTYTEADLKIVAESQLAAEQYAAVFKNFATALIERPEDDPAELVNIYIEQNDQTAIVKLESSSAFYQQEMTRLLTQAIPASATSVHLGVINSLAALAQNFRDMAQVAKEPVLALSSVRLYNARTMDLIKNIILADRYFQSKGIILK